MKAWLTLLLLVTGAGCLGNPETQVACGGATSNTLYLTDDLALQTHMPASGSVPVPGFENAFLTDSPTPFLSHPITEGLRILGPITLEVWVRSNGGPAPVAVGGDPGEGYHLFTQVGSDHTLMPSYAIEYGDALPAPGAVTRYNETFAAPDGGFIIEKGQRIRLLVTSLVLAEGGLGHEVLVGGVHPSRLMFEAQCEREHMWTSLDVVSSPVSLSGHQGLLTGAIPPIEGFNRHSLQVDVLPETTRLTFALRQSAGADPVKDDMDLTLLNANGRIVWTAGSPAIDETGILHAANLEFAKPFPLTVRVDSYSGHAYEGTLTITQESG